MAELGSQASNIIKFYRIWYKFVEVKLKTKKVLEMAKIKPRKGDKADRFYHFLSKFYQLWLSKLFEIQ